MEYLITGLNVSVRSRDERLQLYSQKDWPTILPQGRLYTIEEIVSIHTTPLERGWPSPNTSTCLCPVLSSRLLIKAIPYTRLPW